MHTDHEQSQLAGDGGWNKEMTWQRFSQSFRHTGVCKLSSVPWFQLSTVCRLRTDWMPVSITVNHNACLGEIYIAIPRQLVDTFGT